MAGARRPGDGHSGGGLIGPLLVFEGLLAFSAWQHGDSGGDLQGVEQILMLVVLVPILLTAALVAFLAVVLVEPEEQAD